MKIGLFSDPHYSSASVTCGNRYNSLSLGKMEKAMACFDAEKCDMVIILGDITDTEPEREMERNNLRQVGNLLKSMHIRTVCLMGNHDAFVMPECEFYDLIGTEFRPETITVGHKNFLFLDACWFRSGERYRPGDSDWTDTFLPHTEEMEKELQELDGEVYVFMHQNIDPNIREDHRLANDGEVRAIMERSGKVKRVFQGHYHWGMESEVNGIRYTTLKAMCENEDAHIIVEV